MPSEWNGCCTYEKQMKDDSLFICHNQEILCDVLVKADSYIPFFVLCLFIFT